MIKGNVPEPRGDGATGNPRRWGFIGAGKMATALIRGMLRVGIAARVDLGQRPQPPGAGRARDRDGDRHVRLERRGGRRAT